MSEIRTVAVIGAGNMGSGIAQKYAAEGVPVTILDLDEAALARGRERIRTTLAEAVTRKIYREDAARAIQERIEFTSDWERLADSDLVVEAVFEDLGVKREVFARLGEVTRPDAILGTNTSSFFVRQVAEGTAHPERVVGLHYFYHPAKNRLVEVIPGPETSRAVLEHVWAFQERIGKTPIHSADAPGFIVNRYFVPWINEAARLLEEGVADIATIEQAAIEGFRIGMGPFQLMNVTGIPIGYHAAATLERELGPFYRPSGIIHGYMKSGESFDIVGEPDRSRFDAVRDRLQGVVFHVASQLVSDGVGTIEDTDIGARVGLRWAEGPFEMMNRLGVHEAFRLARLLEQRYELKTPELWRAQVKEGTRFPIHFVKSELKDGIATLTINRPDAMNALDPEVARQLDEHLTIAMGHPEVRGIVIAGAGKAFIAGADVSFFVKNIEQGNFDEIGRFAIFGHQILEKIEKGPKPVVARLDGLALGGGLELALACDTIVATDKASMGFPETGIGIFPGLGGTQRTSRRIGVALTRWLVLSGQIVDARTALEAGLIDELVPHTSLDVALRRAVERGKAARQGSALAKPTDRAAAHPMLSAMAAFFEAHGVEAILSGEVQAGGRPDVEKLASRMRARAPLAMRLADQLITEGAGRPLAEGLQGELEQMERVFRSADAHEGLSALLARRPPQFRGA